MGHAIHFSVYLSKDDLFTLEKNVTSTLVFKDIQKMNELILALMESKNDLERFKMSFEQLGFKLQQFIIQFKQEIKYANLLKFELLKLVTKLKVLQYYAQSKMIENIAQVLYKFIYSDISPQILTELIVFETYQFLGLMPQLSGQDKLWVRKVKNIDLYSELLSFYKKPKIREELTEQYFQKNRSDLLMNLVADDKKIVHIHYDLNYLDAYVSNKMILELVGKNMDEYLNRKIQKEYLK